MRVDRGAPKESFDERLMLMLVRGFLAAMAAEIVAAIAIPGFRDIAAGFITATGGVLALPITTYIGLRFTRELREKVGAAADSDAKAEAEN